MFKRFKGLSSLRIKNGYEFYLFQVGLGDSGLEHNVLVFGYDGKKYPMRPDEFDDELAENLSAFMKRLSSGTKILETHSFNILTDNLFIIILSFDECSFSLKDYILEYPGLHLTCFYFYCHFF